MEQTNILNEIMENASKVPFECQEKILDVLKGMAFTKHCLIRDLQKDGNQIPDKKSA